MKTIAYHNFPQKVKSFIRDYFKVDESKLSSLYISLEDRPKEYLNFICAEFLPPSKIAYYKDKIKWSGIIHDTTHFLQYQRDKEGFLKDRQLVKEAAITNYGVYRENKWEREAFKAQEEFKKYSFSKLSWATKNFSEENPEELKNTIWVRQIPKYGRNVPEYWYIQSINDDLSVNGLFNEDLDRLKIEALYKNRLERYYLNIPYQNEEFSFVQNWYPSDVKLGRKTGIRKLSWKDKLLEDYNWTEIFNVGSNLLNTNIEKYFKDKQLAVSDLLNMEDLDLSLQGAKNVYETWKYNIWKYNIESKKTANFNSYKDQNKSMYRNRLNYYNEDEGANIFWSSKDAQEKRFKALTDIGNLEDTEILDVGCGYADFLDYLNREKIRVRKYTGVDIVPEIVKKARELHPDTNIEVRDIQEEPIKENSFDYVFGSGIFALQDQNWQQYVVNMLKEMLKIARKGVAVNFLKQPNMNRLSWKEPESLKNWLVEIVNKKTSKTEYGIVQQDQRFTNFENPLLVADWFPFLEQVTNTENLKELSTFNRWKRGRSLKEYDVFPIREIRNLDIKYSSINQLMQVDPNFTLNFIRNFVTDKVILKQGYLHDDFSIFLYKE